MRTFSLALATLLILPAALITLHAQQSQKAEDDDLGAPI